MAKLKQEKSYRERVGLPIGKLDDEAAKKAKMLTVKLTANLDKYYKVATRRKGETITLREEAAKVLIEDKVAELVK